MLIPLAFRGDERRDLAETAYKMVFSTLTRLEKVWIFMTQTHARP